MDADIITHSKEGFMTKSMENRIQRYKQNPQQWKLFFRYVNLTDLLLFKYRKIPLVPGLFSGESSWSPAESTVILLPYDVQ